MASFVLKSNPKPAAEIGCEIIPMDYSNISGLTKVLEESEIGTVLSTMFLTTTAEPQNNLFYAAKSSKVTRRFVTSVWGVPLKQE